MQWFKTKVFAISEIEPSFYTALGMLLVFWFSVLVDEICKFIKLCARGIKVFGIPCPITNIR